MSSLDGQKKMSNRNFEGIFIPAALYLEKSLSWSEKILIIEINSLDNYENKLPNGDPMGCYASNEYLAEFLGITEKSVANMVSKLKKAGWVRQLWFDGRRRGLRTSFYENRVHKNVNQSSQKCESSIHKNVKAASQKCEHSNKENNKVYKTTIEEETQALAPSGASPEENPHSTILSTKPAKRGDSSDLLKGRPPLAGCVPVNPAAEEQLNEWLDRIAETCNATSRHTLADAGKWESAVIAAIDDRRELDDFLAVIKTERDRNAETPQFFSPAACLKILQFQPRTPKSQKTPEQTKSDLEAIQARLLAGFNNQFTNNRTIGDHV